jgi:ribosomal protein S8
VSPSSKLKVRIAELLKDEGYIAGYDLRTDFAGHSEIAVRLRWADPRTNAITGLRRRSRPGQRVYVGHDRIPRVRSGWAWPSCPRPGPDDRSSRPQERRGRRVALRGVVMSRIGRKVVSVPKGVTFSQGGGVYGIKGPKGELKKALPSGVAIKVTGDKINVTGPTTLRTTGPSTAWCGLSWPT